jgi:hypothetical protein
MAKVVGHSTKNCQERLLSYIACKVEDNTLFWPPTCNASGTVRCLCLSHHFLQYWSLLDSVFRFFSCAFTAENRHSSIRVIFYRWGQIKMSPPLNSVA